MECVVQGIIETQHVEALEILLEGLCGAPKEQVRIHELCLKSGPNLGVVPSDVRLLCDLAQPIPSWTVRHVGGAMRGAGADQISVLVRTVVESKVSNNVLRFFYCLGYKLDHEMLKTGFAFSFNRGAQITVSVTSVHKMPRLHATEDAIPITSNIHMVEITAPATAENYNEVVVAISSFSEYLAPLLHLSKPGASAGIVLTASAAAASLMSNSAVTVSRQKRTVHPRQLYATPRRPLRMAPHPQSTPPSRQSFLSPIMAPLHSAGPSPYGMAGPLPHAGRAPPPNGATPCCLLRAWRRNIPPIPAWHLQ